MKLRGYIVQEQEQEQEINHEDQRISSIAHTRHAQSFEATVLKRESTGFFLIDASTLAYQNCKLWMTSEHEWKSLFNNWTTPSEYVALLIGH